MFKNQIFYKQQGAIQILLPAAIIGIVVIMVLANWAPFKDQFLTSLYPKNQSFAAVNIAAPAIKIMAVGDSLTHGVKDGSSDPTNIMAGYRYYLYNNLINSQPPIDMVGSLQSGPATLADKDHAGYNGYDCDMLGDLVGSKITSYFPDIVLLMCGVNEFAQPRTDAFRAQAINHLEKVIDNIYAANPNTKIIVSTIPMSDISYIPNLQTNIQNFNLAIPALINKKALEGKKIYLVDSYNGLTLNDLSDHIHPNETGYQKLSNIWQNILAPLLTDSNANGIIANYSYLKPGNPQTVSWFNLSGNAGASWIGLYKTDLPDGQIGSFVSWFYLGNCASNQGTPVSSPKVGKCTLTIPASLAEGKYEFRLYLQGTTLAKKSNQFTLSSSGFPLVSPPPVPSPSASPIISPSPNQQNIISVSPSSATKGATITTSWSNLSGQSGSSWIGLYKTTDPINQPSSFINWLYIGNCSRVNGTPSSAPSIGSCAFYIPATVATGAYELRLFLSGTTFTSRSNTLQIQ